MHIFSDFLINPSRIKRQNKSEVLICIHRHIVKKKLDMYIIYTWTAVSFDSSKAAPLMCFQNEYLLLRVACLHRCVIFVPLPLLNIIIFVYMKIVLPNGMPRFFRKIKRDLLTLQGTVLGDVWLGQNHQ